MGIIPDFGKYKPMVWQTRRRSSRCLCCLFSCSSVFYNADGSAYSSNFFNHLLRLFLYFFLSQHGAKNRLRLVGAGRGLVAKSNEGRKQWPKSNQNEKRSGSGLAICGKQLTINDLLLRNKSSGVCISSNKDPVPVYSIRTAVTTTW